MIRNLHKTFVLYYLVNIITYNMYAWKFVNHIYFVWSTICIINGNSTLKLRVVQMHNGKYGTFFFFYWCDLCRCANMIFFKIACHSPTRHEMDYGCSGAQAAPRTEQYPASARLFASSFHIPLDRSRMFVACNLHLMRFYCRVSGVFSQTCYWVLEGE